MAKDLTGLMYLAFKQSHEISECCLDLSAELANRARPYDTGQIADSGVSALARIAAASVAACPSDFNCRNETTKAIRGARGDMQRLKESLQRVVARGDADPEKIASLVTRVDELIVVLIALSIELRHSALAA